MEDKIEITFDKKTKYFTVRVGDRYAEMTFEEMLGEVVVQAITLMGIKRFSQIFNAIDVWLKTKENNEKIFGNLVNYPPGDGESAPVDFENVK